MDETQFLRKFIIFSGILEIFLGIMFLFMDSVMQLLGIPNFFFWNWFGGITTIYMGVLLWYSAKDLDKFTIIPVISSIWRYTMVAIAIPTAILEPRFAIVAIISMYDLASASLTLYLLKKCGYL